MTVQVNENTSWQRSYDKKYYCAFCEKPLSKIMRHWKNRHCDERQVVEILGCKNRNLQRNLATKLRNLGNHLHNLKVLKSGEGQLEVVYRPKKEKNHPVPRYIPCVHCLGYYWRKEFWKHVRRCPLREGKTTSINRIVEEMRVQLPPPKGMSSNLWKIFGRMREDTITQAVRSDSLIMALGDHWLLKHGHDRARHSLVRAEMRLVARLLQNLRAMYGDEHKWSLEDFIHPKYFKEIMLATKELSGYKEESCKYSTPSLALKLGHSIKKCAMILRGRATAESDEAKIQQISRFLELHELEWNVKVSCAAHRDIIQAKQNFVASTPLSSDVKLLADYLKQKVTDELPKLNEDHGNKGAYSELQQALLSLIILFNRRRSGEVSKMTLRDYHGQHDPMDQAKELGMSELEKSLCSHFKRVEIVGKRGRLVPILLTPLMTEALGFLVTCRDEVEISPDNIYLFASMHRCSENYIRGSDTMRRYSEACGAERPKALRSTKLRKHIATMTQVLDLRDNELDVVAQFLGHDIRVHREYYRLPESTVQTAKVSKILLALDQGALSSQSGKTICDMDVDLDGCSTSGENMMSDSGYA